LAFACADDFLGGFFRRRALRRRRVGFHCDQDVRGLPLLLLPVRLGSAVVLRPDFLGCYGEAGEERILRQHHVLEFGLFGGLERRRVGIVEGLFLCRIHGDVLHERLDVDGGEFDLALLLHEAHERGRRRLGDDAAARDRIDDALGQDLPADAVLVRCLGDPRGAQRVLVNVEREAVAVAKPRIGGDAVEHLGVRDPEMQVGALLLDEALTQHLLDEIEADLRIVEDRGIDALRGLAQPFLLVADRLRELGLRDLAAVVGRDFSDAAAAAEVVIHAEERERDHDQKQNELRDPLVLVDKIKHRLRSILSSPASMPAARAACCGRRRRAAITAGCEKGELAFALRMAEWTSSGTRLHSATYISSQPPPTASPQSFSVLARPLFYPTVRPIVRPLRA
jgi:hypothetical protein